MQVSENSTCQNLCHQFNCRYPVLDQSKEIAGIRTAQTAIFICLVRTAEQRELHRDLVKQLKNKISDEPNKRFFIKGENIICSSG